MEGGREEECELLPKGMPVLHVERGVENVLLKGEKKRGGWNQKRRGVKDRVGQGKKKKEAKEKEEREKR